MPIIIMTSIFHLTGRIIIIIFIIRFTIPIGYRYLYNMIGYIIAGCLLKTSPYSNMHCKYAAANLDDLFMSVNIPPVPMYTF